MLFLESKLEYIISVFDKLPFDERRQTPHALTTAARTAPLT